MKLWLVTTEMHPFSGGIAVYAHHTARMLAAGGVDVTLFCHGGEAHRATALRVEGYRLVRFTDTSLCGRPLAKPDLHGPLGVAFAACEFLKSMIADEGAPDVVEFQDYGALGYFFLKHRLLEMGADAPKVVVTAHRPYVHCAAADDESLFEHRTVFLGDAERWCYAAADAILAPCRFIVEALRRPGMDFPIRDDDVHVVRNPFDPALIAAAPADDLMITPRLELSRRQFTSDEPLLFFGKLQNQKGLFDLVGGLAALESEGRAHALWVWGRDAFHSPTGASAFDVLVRRHRRLFDQVRYFGGYGLGGLRELCAAHPICVLPYREECLPYAFIEVVLCGGVPLVGPKGGQLEMIPESLREVLTADFTDPDALGQRIDVLKSLPAAARRRLSDTLKAEVGRQTSYDAVLPHKLEALERVTVRSTASAYPFVHGTSLSFGPLDDHARERLAADVPQRGGTVRTTRRPGLAPSAPRAGLISVIVPYFEMQNYIQETLQSIEAQTYPDVEVVIVDDGSHSPEARRRLEAIAQAPRRFPLTLLRKYNGGLADARNAGAKVARGDYLYFLDADDTLHPAMLSHAMAVLRRFPNVAYVGAWLREFGGSDREWLVWDIDSPYIGFHNLQICSFLIRAEAWMRFGVNDPAMSLGMEDYESHLRMFSQGVRGVALPRFFFNYRVRAGSMSRAFDPQAKAFLYRRIIQANPDFYRRYGAQLAGMFAENGHGAFAPPPTVRTQANIQVWRRDPPELGEVEHQLERHASPDRLSQALAGRLHHGERVWDYVTGRLLLALDLAPDWAERLLCEAAAQAPENGWFRLYAMVAHLRAGRFGTAQALWSTAFSSYCREQRDALSWVAGLESLRGFPHVNRALHAILTRHGHEPEGCDSDSGDGEAYGASDGGDPHFVAVRARLLRLREVLASRAADAALLAMAAEAVFEAAAPLVSRPATAALISRWTQVWTAAGQVDGDTFTRLEEALAMSPSLSDSPMRPSSTVSYGFWSRSAAAYRGWDVAREIDALSGPERQDATLWIGVSADQDAVKASLQSGRSAGTGRRSPADAGWLHRGRLSRLSRMRRPR